MELKKIHYDFTVCKLKQDSDIDVTKSFYFVGKTDEEISLVCLTKDVPDNTYTIKGTMDGEHFGYREFWISLLLEFFQRFQAYWLIIR